MWRKIIADLKNRIKIREQCNVERDSLIEYDKRSGIDEIIKQNKRINNNRKSRCKCI